MTALSPIERAASEASLHPLCEGRYAVAVQSTKDRAMVKYTDSLMPMATSKAWAIALGGVVVRCSEWKPAPPPKKAASKKPIVETFKKKLQRKSRE